MSIENNVIKNKPKKAPPSQSIGSIGPCPSRPPRIEPKISQMWGGKKKGSYSNKKLLKQPFVPA